MDIRSQLLLENSKHNVKKIVDYVGRDEKKFTELLTLFLDDHYRVTQRAAHPISMIFDMYPKLIDNHMEKVILNLKNNVHVAVKRNTVRMLQTVQVPKKHEGFVMQTCFDYLLSKDEPIAVKVFSMTILSNLAKKYPDIKNELSAIIEELMEYGSAGIKSRGAKILKKLSLL